MEVMPFGVANPPALFQELMNIILSILRRRPVVQELISRGAQMDAHRRCCWCRARCALLPDANKKIRKTRRKMFLNS